MCGDVAPDAAYKCAPECRPAPGDVHTAPPRCAEAGDRQFVKHLLRGSPRKGFDVYHSVRTVPPPPTWLQRSIASVRQRAIPATQFHTRAGKAGGLLSLPHASLYNIQCWVCHHSLPPRRTRCYSPKCRSRKAAAPPHLFRPLYAPRSCASAGPGGHFAPSLIARTGRSPHRHCAQNVHVLASSHLYTVVSFATNTDPEHDDSVRTDSLFESRRASLGLPVCPPLRCYERKGPTQTWS